MPTGRKIGRPARAEPAEPTGFRVSAEVRRRLQLAMAFTDERTLQGVLTQAVDHWLEHLRRTMPGFEEAVAAAEHNASAGGAKVTVLSERHAEQDRSAE